ncbi:hypothetical protein, partial [Mesorhizobium sp. M2C.T.Ca.TU.002.02.1.1]|uniref:hypothetical protein n=1 Tax=Mesorhizobium sp. M2C.T.Ca.TU.002.02.1.1 TaxID=2496788 RepID=UPI0019D24FB8
MIHTLSVIFPFCTACQPGSPAGWRRQAGSVLPSRSRSIWHGAKQNSRGILTCWKKRLPAVGLGDFTVAVRPQQLQNKGLQG